MPSPAGFAGQIGFKTEATWGTGVTVDKFIGFNSEKIKATPEHLKSMAIRGGRLTSPAFRLGRKVIEGPIEMDFPNVTAATLLNHMFGTVATSAPAGTLYTHTSSPASLVGDSMTIQGGRPDNLGTVTPFTYTGCKINEWEVAADIGEFVKLTLGITGRDETTATALAAASYGTTYVPFCFVDCSIVVAAATLLAHKMSLKATNNLRTDHFHLGSRLISEQVDNGQREYIGQLDVDFLGTTQYNLVANGTTGAVVIAMNNGSGDTLTFTLNARFTGETPTVEGPEMLSLPLNFEAFSPTSDAAAITAVLVNADSSAA